MTGRHAARLAHLLAYVALVLASCSADEVGGSGTTLEPTFDRSDATSTSHLSTTTASPPSTSARTTTSAPATTTAAAPSTTTTTAAPLIVTSPGTYAAPELAIRLRFTSEVDDVVSAELQAEAMRILNDPAGWTQSGFLFVADESSELTVVLAEAGRVDALCLPLDTYGTVNCQNGAIVALNADRWRSGGADWDGTLSEYRTYVVNHEVGHLIGLRHPLQRCPPPHMISAAMEPQTNDLGECRGNGVPLPWEIEWARGRPAVIGPTPDWDGPRPPWPKEGTRRHPL